MAPGRFLTDIRHSKHFFGILFAVVFTGIVVSSCGTTEKTQRQPGADQPSPDVEREAEETGLSADFLNLLDESRSNLDDVYASLNTDIPEVFLQESTSRDIGNPYQGYRIQILSTRNLAKADSVAGNFRMWAEDTFLNYVPKAYVLFRQPYYKVHVGNFQFHDRASRLTQAIKSRYPDAWVVHDEVEPDLVPSDTTFLQRK